MIKSNKMIREQKDSNLISFIRFRFVPYWPLFVLLLILAGAGAMLYFKWAPPVYQARADLLIKDEKAPLSEPASLPQSRHHLYHSHSQSETQTLVSPNR